MRRSFAGSLKNPALAKEAYKTGLDMLESRNDIPPSNLDRLMGKILDGVGGSA